ncbi:hypothetical protein BJX63DRAFT_333237 [Aspergillus granulosus]|uniref:Uncharacterized protein n=1 Tax=Aspergillus granulosus TaxID=176169 RepID=A0ABR4HZ65_9EURO
MDGDAGEGATMGEGVLLELRKQYPDGNNIQTVRDYLRQGCSLENAAGGSQNAVSRSRALTWPSENSPCRDAAQTNPRSTCTQEIAQEDGPPRAVQFFLLGNVVVDTAVCARASVSHCSWLGVSVHGGVQSSRLVDRSVAGRQNHEHTPEPWIAPCGAGLGSTPP